MARRLDALLPPADQARVVAAIGDAERRTSGQIRVHVDPRTRADDPLERARALFVRLGMARTARRNGVLLYVAAADRRFAIVGDEGIHGVAGPAFWDAAARAMTEGFHAGGLAGGLLAGIAAVADKLAAEFPPEPGPKNELPDEIST